MCKIKNEGQTPAILTAEWVQERVRKEEYFFSKHGDLERQNDNLTIAEVEEALITERIIEQYFDTGRGESCLLVGFTGEGKPLHVVCGSRGDWLAIITIYIPTPPKFKTPYQRGES